MTYEDFIKHYRKYLIGDLKSMIEKADSKSLADIFSCTQKNHFSSPITISIFSFLDIFGFLIRNNIFCPTGTSKPFCVKDIEREIKSTTANISFALISGDEYFNLSQLCLNFNQLSSINRLKIETSEYNQYRSSSLNKFISTFRHSMAHSFLQKSFHISNSKLIAEKPIFFCNEKDDMIFNVRKFYNSFIMFFDHIESKPNHFNFNLIEFEKNLDYYLNRKDMNLSELESDLKLIYCNCSNKTTSTQTTMPINPINIKGVDLNETGSLKNI
jgi:hypothetical protein